jgi:hypothetical protein
MASNYVAGKYEPRGAFSGCMDITDFGPRISDFNDTVPAQVDIALSG